MSELQKQFIPFRQKPLEERKSKFRDLMSANDQKIPIIFETSKKSKLLQKLNLRITVAKQMKFSKVTEHFRKQAKLNPSETIFFHCDNSKTISPNSTIEEIYAKHKNSEDGFLYIECCEFDAWGASAETDQIY